MSTETTEPDLAHRRANRPAWWKVRHAVGLYETLFTGLPEGHPVHGRKLIAWEAYVGHWCMAICTGNPVGGIPSDLLEYAQRVLPKEDAAWEYLV